jgi:hypothetical protein
LQESSEKIRPKEIEQLVKETSAAGIAFWKGIDVVIDLFSPIMVLLRKADGEQACLGIIYQQMSQVLKQVDMLALHGNLNECRKRRHAVRTVTKARWDFLHQPNYTLGCVLNPEYIKSSLSDDMYEIIDQVLLQLCTSDAEFTELKKQLESFRMYEGDGVDSVEDVMPHEWWLAHGRGGRI